MFCNTSSEAAKPVSVLLVDDSRIDRMQIAHTVQQIIGDAEIKEASSAAKADAAIAQSRPDIIILDYCLPDGFGSAILERLQGKAAPIIVGVSGSEDPAVCSSMLRAGASDFIIKNEISAQRLARALKAFAPQAAEPAMSEMDMLLAAIVEEETKRAARELARASLNALTRLNRMREDSSDHARELEAMLTTLEATLRWRG